ncbi:unnamed protein product [Diplocarpon coronariae]
MIHEHAELRGGSLRARLTVTTVKLDKRLLPLIARQRRTESRDRTNSVKQAPKSSQTRAMIDLDTAMNNSPHKLCPGHGVCSSRGFDHAGTAWLCGAVKFIRAH